MKDRYIFGGGDSDGLLGISAILSTIGDAFFSFTSPRTLHTEINNFVRGASGRIYIVDLALDQSTYRDLLREIESLRGFRTYFFDQHNLPRGVSMEKLPFTKISIDDTVSSCENAYVETGCELDVIVPAVASINDGFKSTELIRAAEKKHGERLYRNAETLKFGLAFNIKDNMFKRELVYAIKEGAYPESIPELVSRYEQGLIRWEEIRCMAESRVKTAEKLAYGFFPNLRGGYANMLAGYLAEIGKKPVGISILETDRVLQKINVISNNPLINLGQVVHDIAIAFGGAGGGSTSSAGATINKRYTPDFLKRLDVKLGG